ncbi:HEPN domain-containing protein [Enterobacter ludwigii]
MKHNITYYGEFSLDTDYDSVGILTLAQEDTIIEVTVKSDHILMEIPKVIHGRLDQLKKATCVDCIITNSGTFNNITGDSANHTSIFPHHVIIGDDYLEPNSASINSVSFQTQDIEKLFQDGKDFGKIYPQEKIINFLESEYSDLIKLHEHPNVFFHSGRLNIIEYELPDGQFRVYNRTTIHGTGRDGKFLTNNVRAEFTFSNPVNFKDCLNRVLSHIRFLSIVSGREQVLEDLQVHVQSPSLMIDKNYQVYSSYLNKKNDTMGEHSFYGLPIEPAKDAEHFKNIYISWMGRDKYLFIPRIRFNNNFIKSNSYDVDRLVSAANLFDILPNHFKPGKKSLNEDIINAKTKCREIFKNLPESYEKTIILGALGRLEAPTLTDIILHRSNLITEKCNWLFPELDSVIKIAVKVRNYFVHGTMPYSPQKIEPSIPFLTDILEFVFVASDLIECDWNIQAWAKSNYSLSHPFNNLRRNYENELSILKESIIK